MEPEYFYTLDLGDKFGPMLEQLAERASMADDIEGFAAMLLKGAIEQAMHDEEGVPPSDDLGDKLPF